MEKLQVKQSSFYIHWCPKYRAHAVFHISLKAEESQSRCFSNIFAIYASLPHKIVFKVLLVTVFLHSYNFLQKSLDPDNPDSDPDLSQSLITCFLCHLGHLLKISSKSIHNFLSYLSLKITFHGSEDSDSGPDHSQN